MKVCSKCKVEKPFEGFVKTNQNKSGYTSHCKDCRNEKARSDRKSDPERMRSYTKNYEELNKDKIAARKKVYQKERRAIYTERNRKWKENNPEKVKEYLRKYKPKMQETKAKRRAAERHAIPKWLTNELRQEIKQIYRTAVNMTEFHEIEFHVDHIEPLRGKTSCGLHVPWNLQILPAKENLRKSNKLQT